MPFFFNGTRSANSWSISDNVVYITSIRFDPGNLCLVCEDIQDSPRVGIQSRDGRTFESYRGYSRDRCEECVQKRLHSFRSPEPKINARSSYGTEYVNPRLCHTFHLLPSHFTRADAKWYWHEDSSHLPPPLCPHHMTIMLNALRIWGSCGSSLVATSSRKYKT